MAGTLVGGLVVAQISRRDDRWKLWAPAITSGLAGPVFAVCMLTSDFKTMVAALAATSFLVGFHLGPIFAIAQTVARPSMRALASAIILLTATCFGQGVGPLAVGMINDALKNDYGSDAVRYSLLSAAATTALGALLFIWAAASIRADIKRHEPIRPAGTDNRYSAACANLMVEMGHFPSWPLMEIRRPWNSSSQTLSTVPALPSVRTTALPTSSV
jgi:MFS family permease